jgi:hypothetical protein
MGKARAGKRRYLGQGLDKPFPLPSAPLCLAALSARLAVPKAPLPASEQRGALICLLLLSQARCPLKRCFSPHFTRWSMLG